MSYSLALGPFHPAWRGPQRFVLALSGERITDVEYQHEYTSRGCADRLPRLPLAEALHLAARVCGACSIAHSLAFCAALEQLCELTVGARAEFLRCAAAEIERLSAHLGASARLLRALGMEPQAASLDALCETSHRVLHRLAGARAVPDLCIPGGVQRDLADADREELLVALPKINRGLYRLIDGLIDNRALLARTVEVGTLPRAAAEQFGVRGPLARASGLARDARVDHPYSAYPTLQVRPIVQEGGDVYARLVVLLLEAYESVKLAEQSLRELPAGDWQGALPRELPAGQGVGVTEGPRGMIRYSLESSGERLVRARIDAPRQLDRLLVRTLLVGGLLDSAVAIIASTDHCTACAEL